MCGSASPSSLEEKEKTQTMVAPASSPPLADKTEPASATSQDGGGDEGTTADTTSELAAKYVPDRDMTQTPPPILSGKRKRAGKRGKIGKKPADMPRRPLSGYNSFFSEQKSRILEEQAKKKNEKQDIFTTLGRIVADRWKKLGDKDKEKYNELAGKDLIRYRKEMEKYNEKIAMRNRKEAELKNTGEDPEEGLAARKRPAAAASLVQSEQLGGALSLSSAGGGERPPVRFDGIPPQATAATALYATPLGQLAALPAIPANYPGLLASGLPLGGGFQGLPLFSQQMDLGRLALAQQQSLAARLDPMLVARPDLQQLLGQLPPSGDAQAQLALAQQQQQQHQQQQALQLSSLGSTLTSSALDPALLASRDAAFLQSLNAASGVAGGGQQQSPAMGAAGSFLNNPSSSGSDPEMLRQTYARLLQQKQQEEEEVIRQLRQRGAWPPGGGGGGGGF